jgi:hypothetical protein
MPPSGLRAFGDIDLWVRPSQLVPAARVLGSTGGATRRRRRRGLHAQMVHDEHGREIDLHIVPSHLFMLRDPRARDAEARFERAWQRRTPDGLALADLIHLSFLNTLFADEPGVVRPAFALVELDSILTGLAQQHPAQHEPAQPHPAQPHPARQDARTALDAVLSDVVAQAVEDRTVPVFVEHLDWLGRGASVALDDLLVRSLEPAFTARDQHLRGWLGRTEHDDLEPVLRAVYRTFPHAQDLPMDGPSIERRWTLQRSSYVIRHEPARILTWLALPSSWRRLRRVVTGAVTGVATRVGWGGRR